VNFSANFILIHYSLLRLTFISLFARYLLWTALVFSIFNLIVYFVKSAGELVRLNYLRMYNCAFIECFPSR